MQSGGRDRSARGRLGLCTTVAASRVHFAASVGRVPAARICDSTRPKAGAMDTVVRTSCPICGDIDVPAAAVTVFPDVNAELNVCAFDCPKCKSAIAIEATGDIVRLLLSAGAQVGSLPPPTSIGGPITEDEL